MNLLLDTNLLSEVQRPAPEAKVLEWLDAVDEDRVYISVASIAELRRGIALMDEGRRRTALAVWLANELPARFADRILPIDQEVAEHWGDLMAQSHRTGVALSAMDGFFAATALAKNLTLVTRNVSDFVRRADVQSMGRMTGDLEHQPHALTRNHFLSLGIMFGREASGSSHRVRPPLLPGFALPPGAVIHQDD